MTPNVLHVLNLFTYHHVLLERTCFRVGYCSGGLLQCAECSTVSQGYGNGNESMVCLMLRGRQMIDNVGNSSHAIRAMLNCCCTPKVHHARRSATLISVFFALTDETLRWSATSA
jgi:hypothetical protein